MSSTTVDREKKHRLADIYHERTTYDYVGRPWRWALLSGSLIVISLFALVFSGLNLGLEFTGGTAWQVRVEGKSPSVADVRSLVEAAGLSEARVTIVGDNQVRVQAAVEGSDSKNKDTKAKADQVKEDVQNALAKYAGTSPEEVTVSDVGGSWGSQVSEKALQALLAFFVVVILYLSVRFEFKMAIAALIAVLHDILITVGAYAVTQWDVTPGTVIAFLTILGFSLYDTVVVFDKIRENAATLGTNRTDNYSSMVNRSMNQVLMRSLNTSIIALLPIISLLVVGVGIMGAESLRDFSLALFCGLLIGAYSSIFVAVPILSVWKEREPKYRAMRERARVARRRADAGASVAVGAPDAVRAVDAGADATPDDGTTPTTASGDRGPGPLAGPQPTVQPRPRKRDPKKKR